MVKTKKVTRSARQHEMIDTKTQDVWSASPAPMVNRSRWSGRTQRLGLLLIVLLVGFFLVKKGYVVAAVVNGMPIFRWQLSQNLMSRFGAQTLESMITERLIADAAQKDGIVLSQSDVDAKIATITATLGADVNLDELLAYQGMTKADFEQQVRLQLTVEKVLSRDVAITEEEIDTFIKNNKDTMVSTDAAAMRTEAREALMSQKTSEKMQPWLMDLRENAKITKFF